MSTSLRPSNLPKLAQCAQYSPAPATTAAVVRGLDLDARFRAMLSGEDSTWTLDASDHDAAALQWAVETAREFAGGERIESRERHLRVKMLGMRGTADAMCAARQWSADLKTGAVRDYEAQQAAYALGFMERESADRWTTLLLFCDAREVVARDFTREEAERIVRGIIARVKDPLARATPCDYCDWCQHRWSCQARLEPLSTLVLGAPDKLDVRSLADDPARLGAVLAITHEIAREDGLHDVLKQAAKLHLEAGHEVDGWALTLGRESQFVEPDAVARYAGELGIGSVAAAYGGMSARKFTELWTRSFGDQPLPDGLVQTTQNPSYLSRRRARP